MQDLRLIGVHEDGVHLILSDEAGTRFSLPLDEALRSAARRDHPRLGQLRLDLEATLRPKDVQAMIRAGLSSEEVAERAGWTVEKVHRYEGPILAEREHIAGLARLVRLRARSGTHGVSPTLGERVAERLRSREIDASSAWWDSRRTDGGSWTVLLTFTAGGRQRQAAWDFDPLARTVAARDDEARWLSEDEAAEMPGPIPAPHLAPQPRPNRPTRLYDVEAEGGFDVVEAGTARGRGEETVDLMAAMRERSAQRGRRRRTKVSEVPGIDRTPIEALPITGLASDPATAGPPPPAHPHPLDDPEARPVARSGRDDETPASSPAADDEALLELRGVLAPAHATAQARRRRVPDSDEDPRTAPVSDQDRTPDTHRVDDPDGGEATREIPVGRGGGSEAAEALDEDDAQGLDPVRRTGTDAQVSHPTAAASASRGAGPKPKPPAARRSGRPSVPSWDDIMFGRKPD